MKKLVIALFIAMGSVLFTSLPLAQATHPGAVLAYSTNMSISELLAGTNTQRAAAGLAPLRLNSKLDQAAQAKANDMVAENYWSHVSPSGTQPWAFIVNAGYDYKAAGENLAYGFSTAAGVITGWMNSPEHRANLLKATYMDVGFGFANSTDYVGQGAETVIVAEYGTPLVATPAPATVPIHHAAAAPAPTVRKTVVAPAPASHAVTSTPAPAPNAQQTPKKTASYAPVKTIVKPKPTHRRWLDGIKQSAAYLTHSATHDKPLSTFTTFGMLSLAGAFMLMMREAPFRIR